jgi:eukaryotic-like serine/threonine-protein kinase
VTQNNFTIISKISDGPSAIVYKALQNKLGRFVLLKVLHAHLLRDPASYERFMREAKACALLHSDHIVQIYDVVEYEGAPTIIMEFVDGKSLEQILQQRGKLPEEFIFRIAKEVLEGLSYAHEQGVVHRDIKPSNILITENETVKITDFGIATIASAPSLTIEGNVVGTPAYMSPEQMRGETTDHRTDLFSVGVMLFELGSGKKLFDGTSFAECFGKIVSFDGSFPSGATESFSPSLTQVVKKLLAPDKDDRFTSASDALAFLRSINKSNVHQKGANDHRPKKLAFAVSIAGLICIIAGAVYLSSGRSSVLQKPAINHPPITDTAIVHSEDSSIQRNVSFKPILKRGSEGTVSFSKPSGHFIEKATEADRIGKATTIPMTSGQDDSGYVSISCSPWGKVFIDDQYIETTPVAGTVKIKAGSRTVTFTNPDFVPIVRQITVRADSQTSVAADFLENAGYIFVTAKPWAEIYIDDQYRDTTPLKGPLVASSGIRKLRLRNPNFGKELIREITVTPKDTIRLNFDLNLSMQ